ncbi:MAG: ice-binding family protein [Desulfobacterium sp.]|nr:ice-binding family protein [Desulfobacterium sp.]
MPGATIVFTPAINLAYNTTYMATITTAAKDLAGNALANDYVWTFDTGTAPDTTAPTVTSTDPADLDTGVIISKKIQASFSEAMDPATITNVNFTLKDGLTPVSGTVSYVGLVATFKPNSDLAYNTTYTATITTAAEDLAGNGLASDHIWSFTTVPALAKGPAPVDLGTAGNFVLLTKSGITTTGLTNITGDLGVSPIDSTAITGFGLILDGTNQFSKSALVTGKVYAANYAVPTPANLTTAISDMQTAYADAAGRAIPDFTEHGAGNISGMNLVPGLYKWGTGLLIDPTGVILTGGPDDVWIFQIANDLTLQNNAIVTLAGGAQAKNIFWQVGTGAHLGTSVQFQGILLASTDITMNTSSTLNGRALAQTNVTLNANAITEP